MRAVLYLTVTFFRGAFYYRTVRNMLLMSFISMFVGALALGLVGAIMNGFEKETHKKLQGIHADVIMRVLPDEGFVYKVIAQRIAQNFSTTVSALAPHAIGHALVKRPNVDTSQVVMLIGIDTDAEARVSALFDQVSPRVVSGRDVLIGKSLAALLGIAPGEEIELLHMADQQPRKRKVILDQHEAQVGGLFQTGIDEFDGRVIFCSLDFLKELFPEVEVTEIHLKLQPHAHAEKVIKELTKEFAGADVYSWKDLYPALVSALKLERLALFFVIALVLAIACMNIIALLYLYSSYKIHDIAILLAMGMPKRDIVAIFRLLGMMVALIATCMGVIGAACISFLINHYRLITLPDAYYVTYLPAIFDWSMAIGVFAVALSASYVASVIATRSLQVKNVARLLKGNLP